MENYGATFRTVRNNKGYTLKQVASGIVSVSFLSKFERGDSDISFSVMVQLLDRMMVTYEEFYFLHNQGKSNAIEEFFNQARNAYVQRDIPAINALQKRAFENYQQTNHIPFHCNALLLEVYRSMIELDSPHLENKSISLLTNYLFDMEVWGYYELSLYNATLFLLPPERVITFSELMYNKRSTIIKLPLLHNVFIRILLNTITYLTGGQNPHFAYEEECKRFMNYLKESEIPEEDIYARIGCMQAQAYIDIRLGQIDKGKDVLQRAIAMYEEIEADQLALHNLNYMNIIVNKQNKWMR